MPKKGSTTATSYRGKSTRQSDAKSKLGMNSTTGQVVHNARMREEKERREREREIAELARQNAEKLHREEQQKHIEAVRERNRKLLGMSGGRGRGR